MKITVHVRRLDLLKLQIYTLPRLRANWIFFGGLAFAVFFWVLYNQPRPITFVDVTIGLVSGLCGAIGGLLAGFLCSAIAILSTSTEKSGTLGEHTFEVRPEGLLERTRVNEQLNRWSGIISIQRSSAFILVRINGYLFHVIPRHGFSSDQEYDRFHDELESQWRAAIA